MHAEQISALYGAFAVLVQSLDSENEVWGDLWYGYLPECLCVFLLAG